MTYQTEYIPKGYPWEDNTVGYHVHHFCTVNAVGQAMCCQCHITLDELQRKIRDIDKAYQVSGDREYSI